MTRPTPAARALVGCLALADGATTNQAFKLAGYELKAAAPIWYARGGTRHVFANIFAATDEGEGFGDMRLVVRGGRIVAVTHNASEASDWLARLGSKLVALGVERQRAA